MASPLAQLTGCIMATSGSMPLAAAAAHTNVEAHTAPGRQPGHRTRSCAATMLQSVSAHAQHCQTL
jgi:hypothetical protein